MSAFPLTKRAAWLPSFTARRVPASCVASRRCHYIAAVITDVATRYAACERCATTWRLPALGAAIDAAVAPWLEAGA